MSIHRPNPVLDKLQSLEYRTQLDNNPDLQKVRERQVKFAPICYNPVIGEYRKFIWKNGRHPDKEIAVLIDGYPNNKFVYHSHDFFEIVYVYSGHCQTLVNGNPTFLSAGDICLYNLNAVHKMEFTKPEDAIFNIVIRQDLFRRQLLELLSESDSLSSFFLHILYDHDDCDSCILIKPDDRYQCEALIHKLIEIQEENHRLSQNHMKAQLMLLLLEITRQHQDAYTAPDSSVPEELSIEAVINYIHTHCQSATLESTARHFGYSTRSLTRVLQKNTGYGFREILQDVRFSHARSMLKSSRIPIEEIAANLGYQSRSNFEIAFKKYCHITPAAYRRQFCAE